MKKNIRKFNLIGKICLILFVLLLNLNSVKIISAQTKIDAPKLTEAEEKEALKIAVQFAVRFSQTKNLNPLLKEFFSKDFLSSHYIEQYRSLLLKPDNDLEVPFNPVISVRTKTLKSLNDE